MKKDKFITDFEDIPSPRQKMPHLSLDDRKLCFDEVELGFSEEIALKEVTRCLSCRRCIGCGLCLAECDQQAIVYDQTAENTTIEVDSIVMANGMESFDARRKPEFGYSNYPNVVTNIELERIFNANGPFGGILMRPSDGEIPQKIAFIQCVGSRDESIGANYCSNICCTVALKQAMTAMDKIENLEVTIFYRDIRPFSNNSENYFLTARDKYKIKFIQAEVESVEEIEKSDNLTIKYQENGKGKNSEFDLVVLSTGITPSSSIKRLSRKVGIRLNKYGFFPGTEQMLVPTSGENVWFAGSMTQPMDLAASLTQASAVAAKVLQSMLKNDRKLNPVSENSQQANQKNESKRVGVFLCRYGMNTQLSIDSVDVIQSIKKANPDIYVAELEYGCNVAGKNEITEAIVKEKLGRIVVAPCYSNTHSNLFQQAAQASGLSSDRVSILELEQQNGKLSSEDVKQKLLNLIKSDFKQELPLKVKEPFVEEVSVIGGSICALQTALDIAEQGYAVNVFVSEKKTASTTDRIYWHYENIENLINEITEQVNAHPKIQIHTQAELVNLKGQAGNFNLTIKEGGNEKSYAAGALILATGAEPYSPKEFLYTQNQNVITQFELNKLFSERDFEYKNIVMIQCVGSRQKDRSYCSRICCEQAIRNALKIKELNSGAEIFVLHRDMRTYDFEEDNYAEAIEQNVNFIRMDKYPEVTVNKNTFKVEVIDRSTGKPVSLKPDLIVLSNGIIPHSNNKKLAEILKVRISNDGLFQEINSSINPLQLEQPGIFAVGLAHSPQRLESVMTQATAVAGKVGSMFNSKLEISEQ